MRTPQTEMRTPQTLCYSPQTVSIANFVFFAAGFLSLPLIAYPCRTMSWRFLYLWTSIPALCYGVLVHFFVPESPRWILVRGRTDEAKQALRSIAALNGNPDTPIFSTFQFSSEPACHETGALHAIKMLWERKWARRRILCIMTVGFGVRLSYYGMPLNVGNLGISNIYLSVTLNGFVEVPASLLTLLLVGRFNRRVSLLTLTIISGVCSLICIVKDDKIPERIQLAIELAAFLGACTAMDLNLIYSIELFPTCVWNSALAIVRQALMLGGVVAPVLVAKGRTNKFWSFGVFGLAICCCGLFTVFLPETKGRSISDTMEEEEYNDMAGNQAKDIF